MNILHLDEQNGWRGGEQQAQYLVQGLAKRGHHSIIAGRKDAPFITTDHGVDELVRIALPFRGELDLETAYQLAHAARRHHVDIIHAHTSHSHGAACLSRLFSRRAKIVVSRRVDFQPRSGFVNRWKYEQPDHFIAISKCIADVLAEFLGPDGPVSTVRSAIDPERFHIAPIDRQDLGVPEHGPLLGNVAALVGHKDHDTLIAAMPAMLAAIPDLHLVIVGDGPLRKDIEKKIEILGIQKSVTLAGYRNDVARLLPILDIFVLSSKGEGLGTSVLDAMACQIPVVGTKAGGIPEMIRHEETGLLAPREDPEALALAIVRILKDPGLAERMAENAKAMVHSEFSVNSMVEGNLAVYESLMATT